MRDIAEDQKKYAEYLAYKAYLKNVQNPAANTVVRSGPIPPNKVSEKPMATQAMESAAAAANGLGKGLSFQYGDISKHAPVFAEAVKEHPGWDAAANAVGAGVSSLLSGGLALRAIPAEAKQALDASKIARILFNTGLSGVEGLARNPAPEESRTGNALNMMKWAALISSGAEVASSAMNARRGLGAGMLGMTKDELAAWIKDPRGSLKQAMGVAGASDEFNEQLFDKVHTALDKIRATKITPAKEAKIARLKNIAEIPIKSSDLENSPVANQYRKILEKKGLIASSPEQGFLAAQDAMSTGRPGNVALSTAIPPDAMLTGTEVDDLVRDAHAAADWRSLGQDSATAANRNAGKVAIHLNKQLGKADPEVSALNRSMYRDLRKVGEVERNKNLPNLLTQSKSLGSRPKRVLRSWLDNYGGSNLEEMANQAGAGAKVLPPDEVPGINGFPTSKSGVISKLLNLTTRPAALKMLNSTPVDPNNAQAIARFLSGLANKP